MAKTKEADQTATPTGEFEPKPCPTGGPMAVCQSLNVWGAAWEAWGKEVLAELTSLGGGGPGGVSQPPKPPFKP